MAERQTRRSQKPLSKDVRVQIPPPAPVEFETCLIEAGFLFIESLVIREEDRQSMVLSPCRNMAQAAMEEKERLVSSPAAPAKNTHRRTPRLLQDEFL